MKWKMAILAVLAVPLAVAVMLMVSPGLIHGEDSVSDDELLKIYANKIPTEVWLKAECKKMAPVLFSHKKHLDLKLGPCTKCHHQKPKEQMNCEGCHSLTPADDKTPKYMKAFHEGCQDCHKAKRQGDQGPPVKCAECHLPANTAKSGANCPAPGEKGTEKPE
jgi:hypothetical protein